MDVKKEADIWSGALIWIVCVIGLAYLVVLPLLGLR